MTTKKKKNLTLSEVADKLRVLSEGDSDLFAVGDVKYSRDFLKKIANELEVLEFRLGIGDHVSHLEKLGASQLAAAVSKL